MHDTPEIRDKASDHEGETQIFVYIYIIVSAEYFKNVSIYSVCSVQHREGLLIKHYFRSKEDSENILEDNVPRNIFNKWLVRGFLNYKMTLFLLIPDTTIKNLFFTENKIKFAYL